MSQGLRVGFANGSSAPANCATSRDVGELYELEMEFSWEAP